VSNSSDVVLESDSQARFYVGGANRAVAPRVPLAPNDLRGFGAVVKVRGLGGLSPLLPFEPPAIV